MQRSAGVHQAVALGVYRNKHPGRIYAERNVTFRPAGFSLGTEPVLVGYAEHSGSPLKCTHPRRDTSFIPCNVRSNGHDLTVRSAELYSLEHPAPQILLLSLLFGTSSIDPEGIEKALMI
jgi:hypothetical protein